MIMSPEIADFLAWDAKMVHRMAAYAAHIEAIIVDLTILLNVQREHLIDAFDNWVVYTGRETFSANENWGFVLGYMHELGTLPFGCRRETSQEDRMKLGIVIPTYNRQDNLTLCLQALANQRGESSLQVAVWDDGSEDKTKEVVAAASKTLDIRYGWHRHDGYRVSLNRNRGIRLLDPDTTHVWFIDSDVMLNPGAVEHARELLGVAEKFVVVGKYIWLPKMEITVVDVSKRWKEIIEGKLTRLSVLYEENILMRDPRSDGLWRCPVPNDTIRGIALGGNLIVPMFWLRRTGGFDESIVGQGQDCEFGYNLQAAGANAICCEHICGYHLSHYRDQKFLKESVKVTIGYIAKKYGNPIDEKEFLK